MTYQPLALTADNAAPKSAPSLSMASKPAAGGSQYNIIGSSVRVVNNNIGAISATTAAKGARRAILADLRLHKEDLSPGACK